MDEHRWGAAVCHRRFGKSVCAVNHLQKAATLCRLKRPRYGYIAPTYTQGKSIVWDYMKHYARPIPGVRVNESELRVDYPNEGQVRIFGADNPDSLRGMYFDGVVLDEYGLHPPKIFTEVLRPMLSDRNGWALFLGTPNGKNQFYKVVQEARNDPNWFFAEYRASQTGIIPMQELLSAREAMTADEYAQEYECSFEASIKGAVYAREIIAVRESGRVLVLPYEPLVEVDTAWDLGIGDSTAIWFTQTGIGGEIRVIDYYEASGEGLTHYAKVLREKGYLYGRHIAPHDIEVRELGTGHSRLEMARQLGISFTVCKKLSIEDGISAVRAVLPKCWFDRDKTAPGLESMQGYRWDYNTRIHEFKPTPVHDWASHGADAFRMFAVMHAVAKMKRPDPTRPQRDYDPDEQSIRRFGNRRRTRRGGY